MAKMTLLQMTQDILNDADSDPVNSIDDTEEAMQIAQVIKTTYFNIMAQREWPFLRTLDTLTGLADVLNPTKMRIPENTNKVQWIKYNKKDVRWIDPKSFKDKIDKRNWGVSPTDANGYNTNADPQFWTSYDDDYIFFDSRDSTLDTTLISAKCAAYVTVTPSWTMTNAFVPLLPEKMFVTLLAAAKATAFSVLKQISNPIAESTASRGLVRAQNEAWKVKDAEAKSNNINYGRK